MSTSGARLAALVYLLGSGCSAKSDSTADAQQGACGGPDDTACPPGSYCVADQGDCGERGGTCAPIPDRCDPPNTTTRVCGCDGQLYPNACVAAQAGQDIGRAGCTLEADETWCSSFICASGHFCEELVSPEFSEPDTNACVPLPDSCGGTASCACLANACPTGAASGCFGEDAGSIVVTCQ